MAFDEHGQPTALGLNAQRRTVRDVCEVLGLCKGLLADGVVNDAEARFLHEWIRGHEEQAEKWPVSAICRRLDSIFADGRIDETERADLQALLSTVVGGAVTTELAQGGSALPLDAPPPTIDWIGQVFVFTGQFAYGTRAICEREVEGRGGACTSSISRRTNYVVIGTFTSRDWKFSSFGTKIQAAVDYRSRGIPIRIIGEDHWAASL
jgi:NAD-dependent DNA ligase